MNFTAEGVFSKPFQQFDFYLRWKKAAAFTLTTPPLPLPLSFRNASKKAATLIIEYC